MASGGRIECPTNDMAFWTDGNSVSVLRGRMLVSGDEPFAFEEGS